MATEYEVPQDLVEKMARAAYERPERIEITKDSWSSVNHSIRRLWLADMTAALRVALEDERVLGELSDAERREYDDVKTDLQLFVSNRRARLLKPKMDAGVAAVKECFKGWFGADWINSGILLRNAAINEELYKNIATAVREADAKLKAEQEAQS